jgi:hypothetical protein
VPGFLHRRGAWRTPRGLAVVVALLVAAGLLGVVSSGVLEPVLAAVPATDTVPAVAAEAAATQHGGMLNPVLPQRILDTRTATGGHRAKLGSGATMRLTVLAGGGVPRAGVSAVLLNVTAVDESAPAGYLTVYQGGTSRPPTSTVNYRAGVPVANLALVPVEHDGTVAIFNSVGQANVVVDVEGWVGPGAAAAGGRTTAMTPQRILDTRHKAPLGFGQSLTMAVEGRGGIPTGGVSAVYADVIAVPVGTAEGHLTAYPGGASPPASSTVNFMAGAITANLTLLPVSAAGTVAIVNHSPGANVIVDVAGWLSGGRVTADAGTRAVPVTRILDTRGSLGGHPGPVGAGRAVSVRVLGAGRVPSAGVAAVIVHVTGVAASVGTYLLALATGYPRPASPVADLGAGGTVSSTAIVPVGPAGAITVYNPKGSLNVVVDVQGWIAAPVLTVVPPLATRLGAGPLKSPDGERALSILTNANRYAMTTWWNDVFPSLVAAAMRSGAVLAHPDGVADLANDASSAATIDSVRRLSMEALSLATSIATGAYNPAAAPAGTGVPTATARARTIEIIRKVAAGHVANTPGGWGATSQSMFLAAYLGTAAWLLWPRLGAQLRAEVAKVVYFEAEWGMDEPLQFYANAAGTILQPGDTGADEDSWYPMADQLAAVMMPGSPHAPLWENAVVRDALIAWSRPSDDENATVVNGAPVAAWIGGRGSNVLSSGDLFNHHRYAPDYSTLIYQNMEDVLLTALAGRPAPRAVTALVAPVYAAYTTVQYSAPPSFEPGGPVYRPGSPSIYYPQGCDWGTGQEIPYALVDAETAAFGVGKATSAAYETLHAGAEIAMQRRHADGHTYGTKAQYKYVGREDHVAQQAAQLYLTKFVRDHALFRFSNSSYWLAP